MKLISIIVPAYNEEANIAPLIVEIERVFSMIKDIEYEILFVNDGSKDNTQANIERHIEKNDRIKTIEFSRNFGKEIATTAGLHHARGDAALMIDADLQHPVDLIPEFIEKWQAGADIVVGLRTKNKSTSPIKKVTSLVYYKIINAISETNIMPGATDYRILDRKVVQAFNKLTEHERMTRGLIDWLGFKREYIEFEANERTEGEASYSYFMLIKLALSSFISHSFFPLRVAGYTGILIILVSGIGGVAVFVNKYIYNDILGWDISGVGSLAILLAFFNGIVLSCLGLTSLYIGNIIHEVNGRPLYVIRNTNIK